MTTMDYYHARCGKNNKSIKCAQRHQLSLSLGRLVVASYVAGFMSATLFFSFFAHLRLPGQQQQQQLESSTLSSTRAAPSPSSSSSPTLLKELFSPRRRDECEISLGKFKGRTYTSVEGGTVGRPKCLIESKFLKVQLHQVQFPGSATLIRDWLFIDYHDRINVLVQAPPTGTNNKKSNNNEEVDDVKTTPPHFWVFEQTKYALESRTSLAIVGGIVEPGEEPEHAAVREVREEMGVTCDHFHPLGRFRTDVNRGVGWTNSYLATGCSKLPPQEATITTATTVNYSSKDHHPYEEDEEVVGAADAERQDLRTLSIHELRDAVRGGRFIEVQWTATVAVALHHPALLSDEVS